MSRYRSEAIILLRSPTALAAAGVGVAVCLVVLIFAPVVTVVGYETVGHRHVADALEQMRQRLVTSRSPLSCGLG